MESSTSPRDTAWAMSEENVDVVRASFEAWNAGDMDAYRELLAPDVEVFSRFSSLGDEPYRGPEGVHTWIAEIEQSFGRFQLRTDDFRDLGDRVLVLGAINLEGRTSGIEIEQPMSWLFELRDGKLARMFFYSNHAEALEAAGLSE